MEKWFADPYQPDIYIEIDGMESGGFLDPPHIFYEESQQILIERFTQHDINVYIGYRNYFNVCYPYYECN